MYELKKNNSVLYKDDVPLSEILNDLKKNYYLEKEQTHVVKDSISVDADSLYFSLLKKIIAENERKNPFDKLEESQKYHFANIQQKMDSDYVKISPEITKIVDEMYNKNQLVTKYLDDSKTSLRISWIALFATLFLSLYQIYLNRKSSKNNNKRFDEIEKKINKKE